MADFQCQLVFQLPVTTLHDFDVLINLEAAVAEALAGSTHEVDGHDVGSGTGNVFIQTHYCPVKSRTAARVYGLALSLSCQFSPTMP